MSDILAQLKAAHEAREMTRVSVPEYGAVWYFPAVTLADQREIARGVSAKDEAGLYVNALIRLARDEAGNRIFDVPLDQKPALKAELHKMDGRVMQRILTEAGGGVPASLAAEIVEADADALRAAISGALGGDGALAEAARRAPDEVIRRAISVIAEAGAGGPVKNG